MRGQEQRAQDTHGFTMDQNRRTKESWERTDAAAPIYQQIYNAELAGDRALADRLRQNPVIQALNFQEFGTVAEMQNDASRTEGLRYNQDRARAEDRFNDSASADWAILDAAGYGLVPEQNEFIARAVAQQQGWDPRRTQRALATRGQAAPGYVGLGSGTGGGRGGFVYEAPQQAVATVLQGANISPAGIAGIMGNLQVEGGYGSGQGDRGSDNSRSDGGAASGIAQWRKERRDAFRSRYGMDPHEATHDKQAEFLLWELTTPEGRRVSGVSKEVADKIINATDPAEAARLFDQHYERSNGKHREQRVSAAQAAYQTQFGNQSPSVDTPSWITPNKTPEQTQAERAAALIEGRLAYANNLREQNRQNTTTAQRMAGEQINNLIPEYRERLGQFPTVEAAAAIITDKLGGDSQVNMKRIQEILDRGSNGKVPLGVAEAAAIYERSLIAKQEDRLDFWGFRDWLNNTNTSSNTRALDRDLANALVDEYTSGDTSDRLIDIEEMGRVQQQDNVATAQVQQLQQQLRQLQSIQADGFRPGMQPLIDRVNAQLIRALQVSAETSKELEKARERLPPETAAEILARERTEEANRPHPVRKTGRMAPAPSKAEFEELMRNASR